MDSLIKNSGGHLRKILIRECYDFHDDFPTTAHTIYENKPLIEYLPLACSPSDFVEFEKLLKTCQKLKVLSIIMMDEYKLDEEKDLNTVKNHQRR